MGTRGLHPNSPHARACFAHCHREVAMFPQLTNPHAKNKPSADAANGKSFRRTRFRPSVESLEERSMAGLMVTPSGNNPAALVNALIGTGVQVSNITYKGNNVSSGLFTGGTGIIGFESGIILSTGMASS